MDPAREDEPSLLPEPGPHVVDLALGHEPVALEPLERASFYRNHHPEHRGDRYGGRGPGLFDVQHRREHVAQADPVARDLISRDLCVSFVVVPFAVSAEGEHVVEYDGELHRYTGTIPKLSKRLLADFGQAQWKLDRMARKVPAEAPWTAPKAKEWDSQTLWSWMRRNVYTPGGRLLILDSDRPANEGPIVLSEFGGISLIRRWDTSKYPVKIGGECYSFDVTKYGVDTKVFPVDAIVALVVTFNHGMIIERHSGVSEGHRSLLKMIDRILKGLDEGGGR